MARSKRFERGMSLVELMVVIVIIGVLTGLALIVLKGRPGLEETCHQLANSIREASRKAVSGGIVDQSQVSGSIPATARARVGIAYDTLETNRQVVTVELRDEAQPDTAEWFEVSRYYLRQGIVIWGYSTEIVYSESGLGDAYGSGTGGSSVSFVELSNPIDGTATEDFTYMYFHPDGSAGGTGEPLTLFVKDAGGEQERRMRVVMMPLQGQPLVFAGW